MSTNKSGYYGYNSHGDVVSITDENGQDLNTYEYDTWGNVTSQTEGMSNPFKYSGEIYDEETGFYYLRARYYDPTIGLFISEDTYKGAVDNPLSLNRYTYVHNNPLRYWDPSGHNAWDDFKKGWNQFTDPNNWNKSWEMTKTYLPKGIEIYTIEQIGEENYNILTDNHFTIKDGIAVGGSALGLFMGRLKVLKHEASTIKLLKPAEKVAQHYIIPAFRGKSKKYADFIKARGVNVDQFTVELSHVKDSHHLKFIHGQGKWNQKWMDWIDANPKATAEDIYKFAGKMMDDYGLSHNKIMPYKNKKK